MKRDVRLGLFVLAAIVAGLAVGCGATGGGSAAPPSVEVTEPWTSGDERALGIDPDDAGEEPRAAPPDGAASASDAKRARTRETPGEPRASSGGALEH